MHYYLFRNNIVYIYCRLFKSIQTDNDFLQSVSFDQVLILLVDKFLTD